MESELHRNRLVDIIRQKEMRDEEKRNELENTETEEERKAIEAIIFKNVVFECKEYGVKQVVGDIDMLKLFTPWIAQRDLIEDHVLSLADSIINNPGLIPVFAAIIDENGNRKLMDGLQRQSALCGLQSVDPTFKKIVRIDVHGAKNHMDETCYDLFERLNNNLKVRKEDLPSSVCGEVVKYLHSLCPNIFVNADRNKANRPFIVPNDLRKEIERVYTLHACSLSAEILKHKVLLFNSRYLKASISDFKILGCTGITPTMLSKAKAFGCILGLRDSKGKNSQFFIEEILAFTP